MKASAISLFQPWASAIALGAKRFETRSWATKHRGLLAIHAAITSTHMHEILRNGGRVAETWRAILRVGPSESLEQAFQKLPRGRVLATCEVLDCVPAEQVRALRIVHKNEIGETWRESEVGDFRGGRYAWELGSVRAFASPFQVKGQQGLFTVELPEKQPATAEVAKEQADG